MMVRMCHASHVCPQILLLALSASPCASVAMTYLALRYSQSSDSSLRYLSYSLSLCVYLTLLRPPGLAAHLLGSVHSLEHQHRLIAGPVLQDER